MNFLEKIKSVFSTNGSNYTIIEQLTRKDKYKDKDGLTLNELSLYLNRAIDKRATKVGNTKWIMKDLGGNVIESKEAEEWLNLLAKPNKMMTGTQFWKMVQTHKDLCGVSYIYKKSEREIFEKSKVKELHILNPKAMEEIWSPLEMEFTSYKYHTNTGDLTFSKDEIIRIARPNPKNPIKYVSLIVAGLSAISTGIQLEDYQENILLNGGKIQGLFKFKNATAKQLDEAEKRYRQKYAGAKKAGLPLFLAGDSDYTNIALSPSELGYLESKKANLDDICLLTGVPKSMLANYDEAKYSNAEEGNRFFLSETIVPEDDDLNDFLNWFLIPDNLDLCYENPVPENREEKRKDLETADKVYALTTNEKRKMLKLEEVEEGNKILIPFNLVPLGEETSATAEGKKKTIHPLANEANRRAYFKAMDRILESETKLLKGKVASYFKGQERRLLEELDRRKSKSFIDELFNRETEIKIAIEDFLPVLTEILSRAGTRAKEMTGSDYDFIVSNTIRNWLDEKVSIFSEEITDTTFEKLKREFSESLESGEDRNALINRINNTYEGFTKIRAKTIARTEAHGAMQKGNIEGYTQGGLLIKIWVAVMDGHTRDSHAYLDGQERPMDAPFSNGLMYPGDPNGSAEQVINCRCTI
jgi:HK97 family phage portal protein